MEDARSWKVSLPVPLRGDVEELLHLRPGLAPNPSSYVRAAVEEAVRRDLRLVLDSTSLRGMDAPASAKDALEAARRSLRVDRD